MKEDKNFPIYEAAKKHCEGEFFAFHTPGHKGRDAELSEKIALRLDLTETGETDNLLCPTKSIARSEILVAKKLLAKRTWFVTTGCTTANFIALCALKNFGGIAVLRSSHPSIYNACYLLGIEPYIIDDIGENGQTKVTAELIESALEDERIKTLALTRPSYYGEAFDLRAVSEAVHKRGKYLFIDEAHGAHFCLSERLPISAGRYADVFTDSFHKALAVLTGGAAVSANAPELFESVDEAFRLIHSTSPSYLVMSSIEHGVLSAESCDYERLYVAVKRLSAAFAAENIPLFENDDFTRLIVDCEKGGKDAARFCERLNAEGVYEEFCDGKRAVFIITAADTDELLQKAFGIFKKVWRECEKCDIIVSGTVPIECERKMPYLKARAAAHERVEIEDAIGRVCGENFGLYPPATPLAIAGEVITERTARAAEAESTFGINDGKITVVK